MEEQAKKKILIVEDDLPVLNALVDKLTREGFIIFQAQNGEEGLIMANKTQPDLILLDIIMPKMDGLEMMKKLRAESEWGKNVPIILLTNLSPDDDRTIKGVSEGEPRYYLIKTDWSIADVVEKAREVLNKN